MTALVRLTALCALAAFLYWASLMWFTPGTTWNRQLMMPARATNAPAGQFTEVSRADLYLPPPQAGYTYEPAASVTAAARYRSMISGLSRRNWHLFQSAPGSGPRPVVVLFHGAGRTGLSMIDMWDELAARRNIILIAPDSRGGRWNHQIPNPGLVHRLLDQTEDLSPIDRDRIFLFGHSDGAIYAQLLTNRTVGPWRATAAHAGYPPSSLLAPAADAKPIRTYLGSEDHIFGLAGARRVAAALALSGHNSELVIIPNHTHWFYEIGPSIAADSWSWFEAMSRR